jgi:hypothetical protein
MTTETIATTATTLATHPRAHARVRDRGMLVLQYGMAITAIVVAVLLTSAR